MTETRRSSSEECRQLLADLPDLAADRSGTLPEHVLLCPDCRARVETARRVGQALGALAGSPVPAALQRQELFEGIFERAQAELEAEQPGAALRQGLVRVAVPSNHDWRDAALAGVETPAHRAAWIGRLPAVDPPGWLWSRIRADIRQSLVASRRRRWTLAGSMAAAAVLLVALAWAVLSAPGAGSDSHGTRHRDAVVRAPEIDFVEVETPIARDASPALILRDLCAPTSGR